VLAVGGVDGHFTAEAVQPAVSGTGDGGEGLLGRATRNGLKVLEDEPPRATIPGAGDALDGGVAGCSFDPGASGRELSLANSFDIAVELPANRQSGEGETSGFASGG
jgi:hypothetical protein